MAAAAAGASAGAGAPGNAGVAGGADDGLLAVCRNQCTAYSASTLRQLKAQVTRLGTADAAAAAILAPAPAKPGHTALHLAAIYDGQPGAPVLNYLLSLVPESTVLDDVVNDEHETPLHRAAFWCKKRPATAVETLLAYGASTEGEHVRNKSGQTPRDIALFYGNAAALEAFEKHSATPFTREDVTVPSGFGAFTDDEKNAWGSSLYDVVSNRGRDHDPETLPAVKAHVHTISTEAGGEEHGLEAVAEAVLWTNPGGFTSLHRACFLDTRSGAPVVCLLLSMLPEDTAIDDIKDKFGKTPLHWACAKLTSDASATAVKALLARGASAEGQHVKSDHGRQEPREMARLNHNDAATAAIERHLGGWKFTRSDVPSAFPPSPATSSTTVNK